MLRREFLVGTLTLAVLPTSGFAFADALIVNRTETCGCCGAWVERINSAGLRTEVNFVDEEELGLIKTRLGISSELSSCHTATIGSYFIEGHVPAEDIQVTHRKTKCSWLKRARYANWFSRYGDGNNKEPFDTLLVFENGKTQVFSSHAPPPSV